MHRRLQLMHDTHDPLAYQADGDGGDEDHDDLVDDAHDVLADEGDDAVGMPHGGEEDGDTDDQS